MGPDPDAAATSALGRYRGRAEETVQTARHEWGLANGSDVRDLLRSVMEALAVEAGRDLRQVLFQLRLAIDARAYEDPDGHAEIVAALDRATAIVRTHLDREEVQRLLISLTPSRFELSGALLEHLEGRHLLGRHGVRLEQAPVWVEADRVKIIDVLGHTVSDIVLHSTSRQHVSVRVGPAPGGGAHVFIGASPSDAAPEELLRALDAPLSMEVATIDVPYVRAVIERHGGTMLIETTRDGGVGFGFRLPAIPAFEVKP